MIILLSRLFCPLLGTAQRETLLRYAPFRAATQRTSTQLNG